MRRPPRLYRLLSLGAILGSLLVLLLFQRAAVRPTLAARYTGIARADNGELALEVKIEPPIAQPGDVVQVTATLFNRGTASAVPTLQLLLPPRLSPDVSTLPAGATINLQANSINWLPVLAPNSQQQFTIPLRVTTADLTRAEQVVQAVLVQNGLEYGANATMWVGILPLIQNILTRTQIAVGQPITLEAEVSGSGPFGYVWDLGDGRRVDLPTPAVVFAAAGQHQITLTVTNPLGQTSRSAVLNVVPHPVANLTADDASPGVGQPVRFQSVGGGSPPLRLRWDFGDGGNAADEAQPTHVYHAPGVYDVQLVVENEFGRSEAFMTVEVGVPPVADLVVPETVAVGQPLLAQALGDESVTAYRWEMGDGRRHEGVQISHLYQRPGDYYITLVADNGFAETEVGRWIQVLPGTSSVFLSFVAQDIVAAGDVAAEMEGTEASGTTAVEGLAVPLEPVTLEGAFSLTPVQLPPGATAAEQLLIYLNEARRVFELPPLEYRQELSAAAQYHSQDKAYYPDSPHVGSDGTAPAERLLRFGYPGGYAGEATAWGFADPREAVEFWVNSEAHRSMILNRYATDVGVGYAEDYATRNIWHWTAEFGNRHASPAQPTLRVQEPVSGVNAYDTDFLNYAWTWPLPLASDQQFVVYLQRGDEQLRLGRITQPVYGSRFVLSAAYEGVASQRGSGAQSAAVTSINSFDWFVRLEDGRGAVLVESERRSVVFRPDPNAAVATLEATPVVTPVITTTVSPTAGVPLVTPTAEASATPQPTPLPPIPTDPPIALPPIVTPTPPVYTPSPEP